MFVAQTSLTRNRIAHKIISTPSRSFGPKGPPGQAETIFPYKRGLTPFQKMIEGGTEFVMGPPPGLTKTYSAHRDVTIDKLSPRINTYARKLREMYFREGNITNIKGYFEPLRMRQPMDTIERCMEEKVIPALIPGREEFEDVDLVFPWKTPFRITRTEHGHLRPWYVIHPETKEEIRVTCQSIDYHGHTRLPYFMTLQRYIVGRPNLINIPVVPVNQDKSVHWMIGT